MANGAVLDPAGLEGAVLGRADRAGGVDVEQRARGHVAGLAALAECVELGVHVLEGEGKCGEVGAAGCELREAAAGQMVLMQPFQEV